MASGLGTLAGFRTTRPNYRVARKKSIIQSSVLFINDRRKKIHVIIIDYNQRGLWSPARTFNKTTCSWCASLSPLLCDSGKLGWRSKLALNTTYRHVSDGALEGLMSQTRQKHQISMLFVGCGTVRERLGEYPISESLTQMWALIAEIITFYGKWKNRGARKIIPRQGGIVEKSCLTDVFYG